MFYLVVRIVFTAGSKQNLPGICATPLILRVYTLMQPGYCLFFLFSPKTFLFVFHLNFFDCYKTLRMEKDLTRFNMVLFFTSQKSAVFTWMCNLFISTIYSVAVGAQCLRCWTTDRKVMISWFKAATIGPLSKAFNPQLPLFLHP